MNESLTEAECSILMAALTKCDVISGYVRAGLPVTLTKNNFGFVDMSADEVLALVEKLHRMGQVAYLRETR